MLAQGDTQFVGTIMRRDWPSNPFKRRRGNPRTAAAAHESPPGGGASAEQFRSKARQVYDGPRGVALATLSVLSLHVPLGARLFRRRIFDLAGAKNILDVGCGAGQILRHLVRYSDADARITGCDLSVAMLRRARLRLQSARPKLIAAELPVLPFADAAFDCVTCGYVLEHLPDALPGLREIARVMQPGARLLLLTSEDTLSGTWTSRLFHCRTYNRQQLRAACHASKLLWRGELWFSKPHRWLHAGGIGMVLEKSD